MTNPERTNPERFLGRAQAYASARPPYPAALGKWLGERGLLSAPVADIGAGTGLFTRLLLEAGAQTCAVEPNPEMRAELLRALAAEVAAGQLSVLSGTSEATGLPAHRAGLITAAQAAHWFDPEPTVQEFRRVLMAGGKVLLVWNDWRGIDRAFNHAYRRAITPFYRGSADPAQISRVPEEQLPKLLPGGFEKKTFDNPVSFTREKLRALAGSVSYLPAPHEADFPKLTAALDAAFADHQQRSSVELTYRTYAFLGSV